MPAWRQPKEASGIGAPPRPEVEASDRGLMLRNGIHWIERREAEFDPKQRAAAQVVRRLVREALEAEAALRRLRGPVRG